MDKLHGRLMEPRFLLVVHKMFIPLTLTTWAYIQLQSEPCLLTLLFHSSTFQWKTSYCLKIQFKRMLALTIQITHSLFIVSQSRCCTLQILASNWVLNLLMLRHTHYQSNSKMERAQATQSLFHILNSGSMDTSSVIPVNAIFQSSLIT